MVTRRGDKSARRCDILDAGRAVLREKGLAGLQMREVARRAGIALGTVYTYFATKESLHATLYAERLDTLLAELQAAGDEDGIATFVRFATGYRDMYADFGREFQVFAAVTGDRRLDPALFERLIGSTAQTMQFVRGSLVKEGVEDPDRALVVMWATISGLAEHFVGPRQAFHDLSWDDTVQFAAETFARSLFAAKES